MTIEMRMTPDGRFIYPWPIIKGEKFLISTPGVRAAQYLILLYSKGYLNVPPSFESRLHSDEVTLIYDIPSKGPVIAFLPKRQEDLTSATSIEKVLSKALWAFVETQEPKQENALALTRRFEAQLSCSSCQGLGISDQSVADFVAQVLSI
ncbi:MAG: hypothetical protein COW01_16050 [Bdellovibrionales bacterium CG12_big_fil_rev_8_21_14_0_65_38_15]|nr:MAG: hypothetical protein COW79_15215 [Bdellovibrionales bacterium CG22_combo_CG10-13_8_21_14_all_38_13]PIQ52479.1 MAG: hypothetical protein COW01_16050 [Bdellovibrionales bacterium CG12_big_fil_rev_8_21_14_0_65_38_15]